MKPTSLLKYLLTLFLITAMGCKESNMDQTLSLNKDVSVRLNQLYTSEDGQYSLKLTEINDSRCPENANCFWSGEVMLKGEWTENGSKSTLELHSVLSAQQIAPDGYTIKIMDTKPFPKIGTETKTEDFIITLLIQKK
jgi:hypothetical protein